MQYAPGVYDETDQTASFPEVRDTAPALPTPPKPGQYQTADSNFICNNFYSWLIMIYYVYPSCMLQQTLVSI